MGFNVVWTHKADITMVRGSKCTSNCDLSMDFTLNLFNLNLSTAKGSANPLDLASTACAYTSPMTGTYCTHNLAFYMTFINPDKATSSVLFADAFVGFVEFTPVAKTGLMTSDNILVALN